ncbi:MAG: hypothetical protein PVG65_03400 [Candidatus Thorarchaeota archaeon]|jgi:hypothetical protein
MIKCKDNYSKNKNGLRYFRFGKATDYLIRKIDERRAKRIKDDFDPSDHLLMETESGRVWSF